MRETIMPRSTFLLGQFVRQGVMLGEIPSVRTAFGGEAAAADYCVTL
jgi:hypothetical protein